MWNLLIPAVASILDKLIPDADEASKAKARLIEMQVKGVLRRIVCSTPALHSTHCSKD